jgi:hypothetical protein
VMHNNEALYGVTDNKNKKKWTSLCVNSEWSWGQNAKLDLRSRAEIEFCIDLLWHYHRITKKKCEIEHRRSRHCSQCHSNQWPEHT